MREIKFRAWDKTLNEFLPNVQNHINDKEWAFGSMLKNDRWVIQQYTGLNDEKCVEIYEGDEVEYEWNDSWIGEWVMKYGTVEYENGSFYPIPNNDSIRNYIVTGHTYENQ